jgi:hypothetical protein
VILYIASEREKEFLNVLLSQVTCIYQCQNASSARFFELCHLLFFEQENVGSKTAKLLKKK